MKTYTVQQSTTPNESIKDHDHIDQKTGSNSVIESVNESINCPETGQGSTLKIVNGGINHIQPKKAPQASQTQVAAARKQHSFWEDCCSFEIEVDANEESDLSYRYWGR